MLRQDYIEAFIPGVWSPSLESGGRREEGGGCVECGCD